MTNQKKISELVKKLRQSAKKYRGTEFIVTTNLLNEAANTIDSLSAKLQVENLEQSEREKLTERFTNGQYGVRGCGKNCKHGYEYCDHMEDCPTLDKVIEGLGVLEDAEEKGILLRLPCKVGEWVCVINKYGDIDYNKVVSIEIEESGIYFKSEYPFCMLEDFGKTVFLNKEDAEVALKEAF